MPIYFPAGRPPRRRADRDANGRRRPIGTRGHPTDRDPGQPTAAAPAGWARPALLGFPWLVWLVVAALLATLVGYALVVPTYRNPDEHNHVDLVLHLRDANAYPDYDEAKLSRQVALSLPAARWAGRGPAFGRLAADQAPPRDRRPSFAELAPDGPSRARNQVANHPFLYYLVVGKALAAVEGLWPGAEGWPFDRTVVVMRLLGALLVATLPLWIFAAARRFGASPAVGLAAALVPLANPQLARQGASVNNDSLLIVLAAVLTLLLARVWTGDRSARTAALVGVSLGLALLTKGFALALVPWVGLAYLRAWWRGPRLPAVGGGALALGLAALVGGWWWLRNLLVFGTVQTELEGRWRLRVFDTDPAGWARRFAGRVTASFWGAFGQLAPPLDEVLILAPVVLATALTVLGIAATVRFRGGRWSGGATPFLLWPIVGTLVILVPGAYRIYAESSLSCCMHGRYLLPGLAALAVVVAVGWGRLAGRRQHLLPPAVLAAGGLQHGVALPSLLLVHYGPPDPTLDGSVRALIAWAPWPAEGEGVLLGACLLVVALVAGRVTWASLADPDAGRLPPPPPGGDGPPPGDHGPPPGDEGRPAVVDVRPAVVDVRPAGQPAGVTPRHDPARR
jgi:small subunit ribosomal protein S36